MAIFNSTKDMEFIESILNKSGKSSRRRKMMDEADDDETDEDVKEAVEAAVEETVEDVKTGEWHNFLGDEWDYKAGCRNKYTLYYLPFATSNLDFAVLN